MGHGKWVLYLLISINLEVLYWVPILWIIFLHFYFLIRLCYDSITINCLRRYCILHSVNRATNLMTIVILDGWQIYLLMLGAWGGVLSSKLSKFSFLVFIVEGSHSFLLILQNQKYQYKPVLSHFQNRKIHIITLRAQT